MSAPSIFVRDLVAYHEGQPDVEHDTSDHVHFVTSDGSEFVVALSGDGQSIEVRESDGRQLHVLPQVANHVRVTSER